MIDKKLKIKGYKMLKKIASSQFIFCVILAFAICSFNVNAQGKIAKIDKLVQKYVDYKAFNGAVLVAENGKVIFKKGYGYANFEWNISNTTDTKFRLGSMTKQFTSMLIMQLVQEGKIRLDEKVSEILPGYPKEQGNKITVHNLLTHTSGIPNYTNFPNFGTEVVRNPFSPEKLVELFEEMPLEFDPGSKFSYSNSGYILLGYIIEKVTGEPYEKVLHEKIFNLIGMENSGYDHSSKIISKRAYGYDMLVNIVRNISYIDMSVPYSAGALYSTVEDLYKWDQALYTDKLLPKENIKKIFGKYIPALGSYYGYGWFVTKMEKVKKDSVNVVMHGGSVNGFNTLIERFVDDKNLIVLLNNTGGTNLQAIAGDIKKILYNEEYELPEDPEIIKFGKIISEKGADGALKYFDNLSKADAKKLSESDINNIGYSLLADDKTKDAIKIFKLNIKLYNTANSYDSYAEALMKDGQKEASIGNYKKSLELNPANSNAIEKLKNLGVEYKAGKVNINPEVFMQFVGEYQLAPNFIMTITTDDDKIFEQASGQSKFEIFPTSETEYYLKVVNAQISFIKDDSGKVLKFILHQNGRDIPGEKIK
jgi:CubicO group peptidase (beta-lactamase class C family)